jgi:hypothetical protein
MFTSVPDWMTFLEHADPLIGVPLVLGGLALMAFGWRLWRLCVALTFGLAGYVLGVLVAGDSPDGGLLALGGALVFSTASLGPTRYAVALLGGLVGAGVLTAVIHSLGLEGPPLWVAGGLLLIGFTALSAINRRHVIILLTAFEGSLLFLSGSTALLSAMPGMIDAMKNLAAISVIVVPFFLLVPTTMSFFYQASEVRRVGAEM